MTRKNAELLMALVITLRSTSLLFSKICLGSMGPLTLLGIRFMIAFAFLLIVFRKELRKIKKSTVIRSLALGFFFYATMVFELYGLEYTNSSTTAFLENTAIILVPIIDALLIRKLPKASAIISGLIALCGVAFLTLKGGHIAFTKGEIFCLICAVFYAAAIVTTDRMSKKEDPILLGVLEVGFIGVFGMIAALVVEQPSMPTGLPLWGSLVFLAVVCSGLGFTLQPVAQKYMPADKAGLYCALNPLIASALGVAFLHEHLGGNALAGATLILASIVVSTLLEKNSEKISHFFKGLLRPSGNRAGHRTA